mgnify:FL=1
MAEPSKAYKKSFGLKPDKEKLFKHPKLPLAYNEKGMLSKVLSDTSKDDYTKISKLDTSIIDKTLFFDISKKKKSKSADEIMLNNVNSLYDLIGVNIDLNKKGVDINIGNSGSLDIPFGKNWDVNFWYKRGKPEIPSPSDYNFGVKIKRAI